MAAITHLSKEDAIRVYLDTSVYNNVLPVYELQARMKKVRI